VLQAARIRRLLFLSRFGRTITTWAECLSIGADTFPSFCGPGFCACCWYHVRVGVEPPQRLLAETDSIDWQPARCLSSNQAVVSRQRRGDSRQHRIHPQPKQRPRYSILVFWVYLPLPVGHYCWSQQCSLPRYGLGLLFGTTVVLALGFFSYLK
jgi:hypothetical protein